MSGTAVVASGWLTLVDEQPWGVVPVEGRGSLPFALVHGESLVAAASWALAAAGCELVDASASVVLDPGGRSLVVHDPLCPLTPVGFLEEALAASAAAACVVAGMRPVTDTVKEYAGPSVGRTHAREELISVASPVVLPPAVVAVGPPDHADLSDLPVWVDRLARRWPVRFLKAPPLGRRIVDQADLSLLEALSRAAAAGS